MKKVLCLLCLSLALIMGGCSKEEEVKKSEITIKENGVYAVPNKPTDAQAKLFNKLTKQVKAQNDEEIASLVAQNFIFDFFSLKNKDSAQDVGGLTYLPESRQDEFKTFAMGYVYANYATIKNESGTGALPMVNKVEVSDVEATTLDYTEVIPANQETGVEAQVIEESYDGYLVTMAIEYDKTKTSDLKKSVVVKVINFDGRYCVIGLD